MKGFSMFWKKKKVSPVIKRMIESIESEPERWYYDEFCFVRNRAAGVVEYPPYDIRLWIANGYSLFKLHYPQEKSFKTRADKNAVWKAIEKHKNTYNQTNWYTSIENFV